MPETTDGADAAAFLRRILTEHGEVDECHHAGCAPWLSIGDGDGIDLDRDTLALVLRFGATDTRHREARRPPVAEVGQWVTDDFNGICWAVVAVEPGRVRLREDDERQREEWVSEADFFGRFTRVFVPAATGSEA